MTNTRPVQSSNILDFKQHPLLFSGSLQTIAGRFWWQLPDIDYDSSHLIDLGDGDKILAMEYTPASWSAKDETVVLMHGLVGCYQSSYIIRMTRKLLSQGYKVLRVNLRGAGPGVSHAKGVYHSGRSEDARSVLNWLHDTHSESKVNLIGFSLSGNIALKTAGEVQQLPKNLKKVIAVSPPADLAKTATRLISKGKIFNTYFVNTLRSEVKKRFSNHPELKPIKIPQGINLIEFDEIYTAPEAGFLSAQNYYEVSSSLPLLNNISLPTYILHALDDPIVDGDYLTDGSLANSKVTTLITNKGGHMGFIDRKDIANNFRWMDRQILNWLSE